MWLDFIEDPREHSAPRGFSLGTPHFPPLLKNQHFQIPILSWNARTFLNEFL